MQKRLLITPAVVAVFILYFTVFGERGLLRISHLHRDRDEIQTKYLALKSENEKLKREAAALQSDKRYLESIARRDFGLVRSNEVIYQFSSTDKGAVPAGTQPAAAQPAAAQPAATQPAAAQQAAPQQAATHSAAAHAKGAQAKEKDGKRAGQKVEKKVEQPAR